jgi:Inner centromere protein, ARK binding region
VKLCQDPKGPVSENKATLSAKERLRTEMRAKQLGRTQLAQPVRPVVAMLPTTAAIATKTVSSAHKMLPLSDNKSSSKKPAKEFVNYEITDNEDSDSDSDDEMSQEKAAKRIPEWAKRENLIKALNLQYSTNYPIDPDELFGEVETCDLEAIFNKKSNKYRRRNSSGDWTKDRVTSEEKRAYKLAVM